MGGGFNSGIEMKVQLLWQKILTILYSGIETFCSFLICYDFSSISQSHPPKSLTQLD